MKLQKMRIKKGFSQNDLAVASNIKKRTIQHYEQGTRNLDSANIETMCALCIALECKLTDILTNEEIITKVKKII